MEIKEDNTKNTRQLQNHDLTTRLIGEFGKWQLIISIAMSLLKFPLAWFQLDIVFLAPPQNFWCKKPQIFNEYSDSEWREICCPKGGRPCLIYDPDILFSAPYVDRKNIPLVPCPKFMYDFSVFNRTITSDWDLVCSRHWLVNFSQCVLMWGVLMGGVLFGAMADKYGRKPSLMVAIFIQALTSYISSLMPWYWGFVANRFILALASGGLGVISFVMCMEIVSGKWRTTIPVLYHLPFGFGNAIMAWLAYLLRDWRKLEFSMALLSTCYLTYWFFIPESPRWLLAKGRHDEAMEILMKAAKMNKREVDIDNIRKMLPRKNKVLGPEPGFLAFLKYKNMRLKIILLSANWFCTGLAFYSFSQLLGAIAENIFLTVAMSGIISTPGALICVYIINKMGRKKTITIFQLIIATCFLLILGVPRDVFADDWPRFIFAGIGFAGMAGTVPAIYLFSGELFPTLGRNVGVGGVNIFARIGSMMAPALVTLGYCMEDLPMILLTIMSVAQIFLVMPLPETKDCPLPDTIEQAEKVTMEFCQKHRNENSKLEEE